MKRKLEKLVVTLLMCVMMVTMVACGGKTETESSKASEESSKASEESSKASEENSVDKILIGFSNCSQDTPFFANMTPIIEDYAKTKNIEVVSLNADNDVAKQNKDIQDLVLQGIDVLIVNPVNEDGPSAGIEACNKANIPVITVDKNVKVGNTSWVGRDNKEMGRQCGEKLLELLGGADKAEGVILEIQGTAGSTTMMQRRDGFHEAIEGVEGLKIVQSSYCDFDRSKAMPATQDLLQANDNVVAVFGHNDDMALGGAQVCIEQGLDDVLVCGVDGLMEAVLKIKDGSYACTTSNDPVLLGQTAVDVAIQILDGEEVESFVDAGTVVIDPSNVDEYADESLDFATMVK